MVGQQHLLGPGKSLRVLIEYDRLSSLVLWGPPGTGKTTIARLVAGVSAKAFETLSAVSAGVKDVREVAERARARLGERGQGTILFLDEVHRFSRAQQDVLLPFVEEGLLVLVGATTENPFFSLTGPLLSRSTLFRLEPLADDDLRELAQRALNDKERGLGDEATDDRRRRARPPRRQERGRRAPSPHRARSRAHARGRTRDRATISLDDAEAALALRSVNYGDDEHYDIVSAFIKSIRGSDPDAGVYWLARMLEAGEDARFIARRLVILASEDIGLADPQSLLVANAAAHAVEYVGLPGGRAQPRACGHAPCARAEVQQRGERARCGHRRRYATAGPGRSRCTCAIRTTAARRHSVTARATYILTMFRRAGCRRITCRRRSPVSSSTVPRPHGAEPAMVAALEARRRGSQRRRGRDGSG